MFNVLFIDRSNPAIYQLAIHLAEHINNDDVTILFLSDKEKSAKQGNLEVVNISDIPQSKSLVELQAQYDFSLHKTLVTERAFFDYSSFRKAQQYSDLKLDDVYRIITPYINALDYLIRERADLVIEGLADNFMTSVAGKIAKHYHKKFFMAYMYYWWANGLLMVDRMDQTSSIVDEKYKYYLDNPTQLDRAMLDSFYGRKVLQAYFPNNYTFRSRIVQVMNRSRSYEPISIKNWLLRRLAWLISKLQIKLFLSFEREFKAEQFVLFPLHVAPEASLLGSAPELADQFSLIKNLSINLPAGVFLYVKEHPYQQMGLGLDYYFYKRLQSLPNVRLYGTRISAEAMYCDSNCLGVAVIAGTVGLEAAIKKIPVFVFGRPIYHAGDCFIKPKNFDDFFLTLKTIMNKEYSFNKTALYAILQALKESVIQAEVDFTKARNWLELGYLGNANTVMFINQQYHEWAVLNSTSRASLAAMSADPNRS
jgi:Capsule polysaccharide biosynthesis protein